MHTHAAVTVKPSSMLVTVYEGYDLEATLCFQLINSSLQRIVSLNVTTTESSGKLFNLFLFFSQIQSVKHWFVSTFVAISNEDFTESFKVLTYLDGQSSSGNSEQCVSIGILDDDILEDNEEFSVLAVADSPVNVVDGEVTVVIIEDPLDSEYMKLHTKIHLGCNCIGIGTMFEVGVTSVPTLSIN